MKALRVLKFAGFGILGIAFVILVIFGVQALWNWLIPALFNGPVLTYWQTAGLFLLSKILLTGLAPGGGRRSHYYKYRKDCYSGDWRRRYEEKFKPAAEEEQYSHSADQV
jgi:hypothetical protein